MTDTSSLPRDAYVPLTSGTRLPHTHGHKHSTRGQGLPVTAQHLYTLSEVHQNVQALLNFKGQAIVTFQCKLRSLQLLLVTANYMPRTPGSAM